MVLSKAKKKNCIVVFSAGNDHVLSCLPPQNRTGEAIVVCASEKGNKATVFTNYADASTVSAPGLDIYSSVPSNKYSCLDGTSMATPVVSGIVALMKSQKPDITVSQVISVLQESGVEQSGNIPNMVQADKALEYLSKTPKKEEIQEQDNTSKEIKYSSPTGYLNGYGYVDLGLPSGTKWATCNVGANVPEEYGNYFAWGETSSKQTFSYKNYKYGSYKNESGSHSFRYLPKFTKYCNDESYGYNGFIDNLTILEVSDDAATVNWGNDWRTPTYLEMQELIDKCSIIWINRDDISGIIFIGINGNSIFLPYTGRYDEETFTDGWGCYWSSSMCIDRTCFAKCLYFYNYKNIKYNDVNLSLRDSGMSVRPVCNVKK